MIVGKEDVDPAPLPHRITSGPRPPRAYTFRPPSVLRALPVRGCTLRRIVFGISVSPEWKETQEGKKIRFLRHFYISFSHARVLLSCCDALLSVTIIQHLPDNTMADIIPSKLRWWPYRTKKMYIRVDKYIYIWYYRFSWLLDLNDLSYLKYLTVSDP